MRLCGSSSDRSRVHSSRREPGAPGVVGGMFRKLNDHSLFPGRRYSWPGFKVPVARALRVIHSQKS